MSRKVKKFGMYFMLIVVSIISIFPIFWMVIASTNRSVDVIGGKLTVGTYLLENYKTLVSQQPIWGNFWNSLAGSKFFGIHVDTQLQSLCLL